MEEKKKGTGKRILYAGLSWIAIFLTAMILRLFYYVIRGSQSGKFGLFEVLQLLIFPALFYLAGYLGPTKFSTGRYEKKRVMLFGVIFAAVLMGVWYLSVSVSAFLNMPAAQACFAMDHWMRGWDIVYKYEYTYLGRTNLYLYFVLPLCYFLADLLYWFCFYCGNDKAAPKKKPKKKHR